MKVGLFFGSFNPVHIGHMALANYFVAFTDIDELWFVVSPHNPLKRKSSLLDDYARLEMVRLAIADDLRFRASDIEFQMPQPSFTINTLAYLGEKYPMHEFVLIMGSDGLNSFNKWKNAEEIINNYTRYVYPRYPDTEETIKKHKNTLTVNAPRIEISSTMIRNAIKEGKNVRHFLPQNVFSFIDKEMYFKQIK
ncbi:MAG: nicotinate-nucleotide adenylyltransferase [Bacteroidales bacterium]|nr:nicotinate-nucleotide adenylyltransferase [Bacteroidales bacterium]MBN2819623.1 nicotinate-nucleotide adenylyltransferase [Bacteroidales bacterium]